jgi:hypothetical protein
MSAKRDGDDSALSLTFYLLEAICVERLGVIYVFGAKDRPLAGHP